MQKGICGLGYPWKNFFEWYCIDSMFLGLVILEQDHTHRENIEYEQLTEFAAAKQL